MDSFTTDTTYLIFCPFQRGPIFLTLILVDSPFSTNLDIISLNTSLWTGPSLHKSLMSLLFLGDRVTNSWYGSGLRFGRGNRKYPAMLMLWQRQYNSIMLWSDRCDIVESPAMLAFTGLFFGTRTPGMYYIGIKSVELRLNFYRFGQVQSITPVVLEQ